jgi:hypothetical protein
MSEKLDGVRAYWTGHRFSSRLGNVFSCARLVCPRPTATALDDEFWIDRKAFQRTVGIVRRQDKTDLWNQVRFLIFDAPDSGGGFEQRLRAVERVVRATPTGPLPRASIERISFPALRLCPLAWSPRATSAGPTRPRPWLERRPAKLTPQTRAAHFR